MERQRLPRPRSVRAPAPHRASSSCQRCSLHSPPPQTPLKLYLVLDFINGGHLFFQLYRAGTFDEAQARLYTAEIVLAIAHLHSLGFVHRCACVGEVHGRGTGVVC